MKMAREDQIDEAFFALSHPVRRKILERLAEGEQSVAGVSSTLDETPSQMTKHLHILERSGMMTRSKEGRTHKLALQAGPLKDIMEWVSRYQKFWDDRFDALEAYLHTLGGKK